MSVGDIFTLAFAEKILVPFLWFSAAVSVVSCLFQFMSIRRQRRITKSLQYIGPENYAYLAVVECRIKSDTIPDDELSRGLENSLRKMYRDIARKNGEEFYQRFINAEDKVEKEMQDFIWRQRSGRFD